MWMNQTFLGKKLLCIFCMICKFAVTITGHKSAQISQKQDERNIYVIMKTMCPPGYHHNGFVATHALGHMMYGFELCTNVYLMYLCEMTKEKT